MTLFVSIKTRQGLSGERCRLDGWAMGQYGPVSAPAEITLWSGPEPVIRVVLDPQSATLRASANDGSLHYYRLADATLRPLPVEAPALTFSRGDAYIAVTSGAAQLAGSLAIARFLHERDDFNAERLAESVLEFLAEESGQAAFPEDVTVIVVEQR